MAVAVFLFSLIYCCHSDKENVNGILKNPVEVLKSFISSRYLKLSSKV